jgi:4-amino-4-deoxy-L-arabinose transferase-like glycosyltransferase
LETVRREKLAVLACLVSYLVLAVVLASVRAPQSDEGHFAEGAANLAANGQLVMPTWTPWLPTLNQHVYAVMPVYFFGLAAWFRLFGVGMLTMRYFSVFWGCILILSYYLLVRNTTKDSVLGVISIALLASSYDVINLTSARYDGMAAALSALGLATYAVLRKRNLALAIVLANTGIAAAAMTHPYGALGFIYFGIFFLILDRDRFRVTRLVLAAIPYLVALAAWGLYIEQDPGMFKAQFGGNAAAHTVSVFHSLAAVGSELRDRYWRFFGGEQQSAPAYVRLRLGILLLYLVSFVASLLTPAIRREKVNRAALACSAVGFLALMFAEGSRGYIYLVHVIGFYSLVAAIWIRHVLGLGHWQRCVAIAVIAGLALFTVATIAYRAKQNSYKNAFLPAANYLRQHVYGQQLVFAGGDFGVPLGFADHVLDDRLAGYRSGRHADYIVIDRDSSITLQQEKLTNPEIYAKVMQALQSYHLVFQSRAGADFYKVYARPDAGPGQSNGDSSGQPAH